MKLGLFTICEGAFNHNGHLTIVNTLDFINADKFPVKVSQLGMAIKLRFTPEDKGNNTLKVICLDANQQTLAELETPVVMPEVNEEGIFCITSNLSGLLFSTAGKYFFKLAINDEILGEYELYLKQKQ